MTLIKSLHNIFFLLFIQNFCWLITIADSLLLGQSASGLNFYDLFQSPLAF
jgi:hypothetical protein